MFEKDGISLELNEKYVSFTFKQGNRVVCGDWETISRTQEQAKISLLVLYDSMSNEVDNRIEAVIEGGFEHPKSVLILCMRLNRKLLSHYIHLAYKKYVVIQRVNITCPTSKIYTLVKKPFQDLRALVKLFFELCEPLVDVMYAFLFSSSRKMNYFEYLKHTSS